MDKILAGIERFHRDEAPALLPLLGRLVKDGQEPKAMLITCSDSRVVPDLVSSTDPGDLFIVRNVGNIVPPAEDQVFTNAASTGAAIEFAIEALGVRDIIVMGHGDCGACKAIRKAEATGLAHLDAWLANGKPALHRYLVDRTHDGRPEEPEYDALSKLNVVIQLENLASYPSVQRRLVDGELKLHGWWFDIEEAHVYAYDLGDRTFKPIERVYGGPLKTGSAAPERATEPVQA